MRRPVVLVIAGLAVSCLGAFRGDTQPAVPASSAAEPVSTTPEARRESLALPAPGESVQHRLETGVTHVYALPSRPGQLLRVVLWEQGADVVLRLLSPGGEVIRQTDHPGPRPGALLLEALLDEPGEHRLEVALVAPGARSGLYRLRLEALREATAEDRERAPYRQQAHRWLDEALVLVQEHREEQTRQAIALCEKALELWRRGEEPFGEGWTLQNLGELYDRLGKTEEARWAFTSALAIWQEQQDAIGEASTLGEFDGLLSSTGDSRQAEKVLRKSLEVWRREGDRQREADALNDLAIIVREKDADEGERLLRTALAIWQEEGDLDHQAVALVNLGTTAWGRGHDRAAIEFYERARVILATTPDDRLLLDLLLSEGAAYRRLGRLQAALDCYAEAGPIAIALGEPAYEANLHHNLASLYHHLGDWDKALAEYQEALKLWQRLGYRSRQVSTVAGIGWLYLAQQRFDDALAEFDRALAISRGDSTRQPPDEALALHGRGLVQAAFGAHQAALEDLQEALRLREQLGRRSEAANTLSEMGAVYLALGQDDRAAAVLREALAISSELGDQLVEAVTLARLSRLDRVGGDLLAAREHLDAALRIYEGQRRKIASQELRASVLASRRKYFETYVDLLLELDRKRPHEGYAAEGLQASERARARGLVELLTESRINLVRDVPAELKRQESELDDRITEVQTKLIERVAAGAEIGDLLERRERLREERARLAARLRQESPRYADLVYPEPLGLAAIQQLLDSDTALLEYMIGEEISVLFVVTESRLETFRLPIGAGEIDRQVGRLRQILTTSSGLTTASYLEVASGLYQSLLQPAAGLLEAKSRLLIAPDAGLYYLPFETLLTERSSVRQADFGSLPYLLRRFEVSYVPSASALASLALPRPPLPSAEGEEKSLVAFADPVYQAGELASSPPVRPVVHRPTARDGTLWFPRLPATRREVERIATLFEPSEVKLFVREEASEANFKDDPRVRHAHRLHLAAHGVVDEEQPANSGLILNLWGNPQEDGLLQLDEIFNLHLAADLVVLSACSTAAGKQLAGEGLVGLSRAFLYAGAPSLVVSLWRVEDDPTAVLMVAFYRSLLGGASKSGALQRAKLDMLSPQSPYNHPSYWAPFILMGRH